MLPWGYLSIFPMKTRHEYPYIEYIYNRMLEDRVMPELQRGAVSLVLKYFVEYIFNELLLGNHVPVYGLGKFKPMVRDLPDTEVNRKRFPNGEVPSIQHYIRFVTSANILSRFRSTKGTCSISELKRLEEKDTWMQNALMALEQTAYQEGGFIADRMENKRKVFQNKRKQLEKIKAQIKLSIEEEGI